MAYLDLVWFVVGRKDSPDYRGKLPKALDRPFLAFLLSTSFLIMGVQAQTLPPTTADDQAGEQPYVSYHGGDIDSIGLTNGTLSLKFPFLSYPQRGKLRLSFDLMYHNSQQHQGWLCITAGGKTTCKWYWGYGAVCCALNVSWAQNMALHGSSISTVSGSGSAQVTQYLQRLVVTDAGWQQASAR